MSKTPDVSIIIPCKNEGEHIRRTLDSMLQARTGCTYEIIVADDASTDDCCRFLTETPPDSRVTLRTLPGVGSANARNEAAREATGEILLFCDAHIFVADDWLDRLLAGLARPGVDAVAPGIAPDQWPDVIGYGMTWDHRLAVHWRGAPEGGMAEAPILPGGCLAIPAATFWEAGGFEKGFKVWGREDEEFSLRLWLFGYRLWVTSDVRILHVFRQSHPYSISMIDLHHNSLRMALSHFNEQRIGKVAGLIRSLPVKGTEEALGQLALGDIWEQRQRYFDLREHDDDWFMTKFGIPF